MNNETSPKCESLYKRNMSFIHIPDNDLLVWLILEWSIHFYIIYERNYSNMIIKLKTYLNLTRGLFEVDKPNSQISFLILLLQL